MKKVAGSSELLKRIVGIFSIIAYFAALQPMLESIYFRPLSDAL
jgi:hypothetical protein